MYFQGIVISIRLVNLHFEFFLFLHDILYHYMSETISKTSFSYYNLVDNISLFCYFAVMLYKLYK